tara:strand:+ start:4530 stop:4928 length:399 start_codon:yes stop_codon:yes gene_type:complete
MAYLVQADITDKVAFPFIADTNTDIDFYLTKGDKYIVSFAQSRGVLDSADILTPLVIELQEYGLAMMYVDLFADVMNVNNNDAFDSDKYAIKMQYYKTRGVELKKQITYEMITGDVKDITDRHASSFDMYRA